MASDRKWPRFWDRGPELWPSHSFPLHVFKFLCSYYTNITSYYAPSWPPGYRARWAIFWITYNLTTAKGHQRLLTLTYKYHKKLKQKIKRLTKHIARTMSPFLFASRATSKELQTLWFGSSYRWPRMQNHCRHTTPRMTSEDSVSAQGYKGTY